MRDEYNEYPFSRIERFIEKGKKAREEEKNEAELAYMASSLGEFEFMKLGYDNPNFEPIIGEFYRIGEPRKDGYGKYKPSWNYAEDKPEDGVSVVTSAWLNSMKSVFFNTTDENIEKRGVYKIRGFALPSSGGDEETLICPLDWAEKTRIRTRDGLERAVKREEKKQKEEVK